MTTSSSPTVHSPDVHELRSLVFAAYAAQIEEHAKKEMPERIAGIESILSSVYPDLSAIDPANEFYLAVAENVSPRFVAEQGEFTARPSLLLLSTLLEDVYMVEDLPFDFLTHLRFMRILELEFLKHDLETSQRLNTLSDSEAPRVAAIEAQIERYGHVANLLPLDFVLDSIVEDLGQEGSLFTGWFELAKKEGVASLAQHAPDLSVAGPGR